MHTPTLHLAPAAAALSAGALALGLLAPTAAVAHADRSALRAAHARQYALRAEERATRAAERLAAREARRHEREADRAAREQQRAARRAEGHGGETQSAGSGEGAGTGQGEPLTPTPPAAPIAPSTPSASANLNRCRVTIEASAALISVGETVTIFGKLSCPPGTSAAERELTVSAREHGAGPSSFAALAAATSEVDGSYKLTSPALEADTTFRVRVGDHGAHTVVRVAPVVTLSGPSPTAKLSTVGAHPRDAHPARVTFSGIVKPGDAAARVSLQVAYAAEGEQWRTVAFGAVAGDGSFAVSHAFRTAGEASVRVLVHMRGHNPVAASETLTYEVAQAQNPQLTIESSAAPLAFGQAATLSGVAAAGAGQTITLLAHTHGGGWTPVSSTTTGPGGEYSFTQAPTQITAYRTSAGATRSALLYEGVRRVLTPDPPAGEVQAGQAASFTGAVSPADDGQTVYAERQNASGLDFHIVASATIAGSSYSISHAFVGAGSYVMRIRVPGDPALLAATSAPFTFIVAPAPAAALTPEAPAASPAS
ncbi:MAG: hypothetical protein ACHQHO_03930 [Solirubrobacterales bacterium]